MLEVGLGHIRSVGLILVWTYLVTLQYLPEFQTHIKSMFIQNIRP